MNIKKRIKQLEARCDLLERTIVDHIFLDDHMFLDDHADEEFTTIFRKDHPDFKGEALGGNPTPLEYRLENVEKVTCDLTEKIDRIETVQNIDIITNKPVDDEPEIIGDYMHYRGEDYYFIYDNNLGGYDCCNLCAFYENCYNNSHGGKIDISCENGYWKNIKEIDITDNIAKLRPWVVWDNLLYKLVYAIERRVTLTDKKSKFLDWKSIANCTIATIADLKKAGVSK